VTDGMLFRSLAFESGTKNALVFAKSVRTGPGSDWSGEATLTENALTCRSTLFKTLGSGDASMNAPVRSPA